MSMNMVRKFLVMIAAMFAMAMPLAAHAQDAAVEQAKAMGVVGEKYDGYIGIADPSKASADLKRRVDEINAKRLAAYNQTASTNNQPVTTIAALTAEKLIARAGAGQVVMAGPGDAWTKKQ